VVKAVPGDTLLAAGAHPVYYRRTVTAPGQPVSPSGDGGFTDHLGYRLEHLSTLSGLPLDTVRSAVEGAPQIQWHTFDAYVLDRDAAIDAQTEAVTRLATALQSTGALTGPEASALAVRIHVHQQDHRTDRSIPLPPSPGEVEVRFNEPSAL